LFSVAAPSALVIVIRASPNLQINHERQNNNYSIFAIILLSNNMSPPYTRSPCKPFKPPSLRTTELGNPSNSAICFWSMPLSEDTFYEKRKNLFDTELDQTLIFLHLPPV